MEINVGHNDLESREKIRAFTAMALEILDLSIDSVNIEFSNVDEKDNAVNRFEAGELFFHGNSATVMINPRMHSTHQAVTICHELTHLKQMVIGRLIVGESNFIWDGESYPFTTPYDERPWEVEAHKNETDLFVDTVKRLSK